MELIQELGIRSNGKRGYMWALFKCPTCNQEIERMKHQGKSQEQCPTCARKSQIEKVTSHGSRYTRIYRTWVNMRARCSNPNDSKYHLYGGRGITVCKEWDDFSVFENWAISNGYTDELTIDRINVNQNYEPNNVQFISNQQNAGKDKITVTAKQYKDILAEIATGISVKDAYESKGISRTAYYNAKKRYTNV